MEYSNDFNLKNETSCSIQLDVKYFWISLHGDIALLIRAFLSYFLVFAILTFKNHFEKQDVSYQWKSEE